MSSPDDDGDGVEALCARARRTLPRDPPGALLLIIQAIELTGARHRQVLEIVTAAAVAAGALAAPADQDPDPRAPPASTRVVHLHLGDGGDYVAVTSRPVTPGMLSGLNRFVSEHNTGAGGTI
jgi:hypothetical protein